MLISVAVSLPRLHTHTQPRTGPRFNKAGIPYIPNLSVQWDSSPRTVVTDTFELGVYPFTGPVLIS